MSVMNTAQDTAWLPEALTYIDGEFSDASGETFSVVSSSTTASSAARALPGRADRRRHCPTDVSADRALCAGCSSPPVGCVSRMFRTASSRAASTWAGVPTFGTEPITGA